MKREELQDYHGPLRTHNTLLYHQCTPRSCRKLYDLTNLRSDKTSENSKKYIIDFNLAKKNHFTANVLHSNLICSSHIQIDDCDGTILMYSVKKKIKVRILQTSIF